MGNRIANPKEEKGKKHVEEGNKVFRFRIAIRFPISEKPYPSLWPKSPLHLID